jgi:phosphatidylinositol alpha-1,6-mannosyltransferase
MGVTMLSGVSLPRDSNAGPCDLLVVSELFPPSIGGSGELLFNVYSRLEGRRLQVLAEGRARRAEWRGPLEIHRSVTKAEPWGLSRASGLRKHISVARQIRALAGPRTRVHCARALPEGLAAWLSFRSGGPRYVCWAHGEDVTIADSSRELRFLARRVYCAADFVIANSQHTASLLRGLGVPKSAMRVIRPGVDIERFRPGIDAEALRSVLAPSGELILLSVGRLQRRKGHDLVIDALARTRRRMPAWRYVIVGEGDERQALESRVADAGLQNEVIFVGGIDEKDLPAYFAACDIFLMPNRVDGHDVEGFGIVFLEAAASAKAVIGGRSGGVPEAVQHGVTGLLVSGDDASELAQAITELATNPELRRRMGDAGRARVVREFTWDRSASELDLLQTAADGAA